MTAAWAEPRHLPLVHVTWSSASVFCPSRLFSLPLRRSVIDCSPGRGLEPVLGVNKALAPTGPRHRAGCSEVRFATGLFLALFCLAFGCLLCLALRLALLRQIYDDCRGWGVSWLSAGPFLPHGLGSLSSFGLRSRC